MTFQGAYYNLGYYKSKDDAVSARKAAEEKRNQLLDWYDSLPESDREFYKIQYDENRKEFKKFCEKIRSRN